MKFKIGQKVREIASGYECIIVATKEEPQKKTLDPYNRSEVYPESGKDYLVLKKVAENNYLGEMNVYETQLEEIKN
ncbi:hypothetical protein [Chryseobacterium sp.]|uniref:hypothetical protein n=1 Tax=Chryseobacterium sp. TaxID=1871047 RepID=UPI0024E206DC|nr:hypothetical protein [Chryseobacterium sp.]